MVRCVNEDSGMVGVSFSSALVSVTGLINIMGVAGLGEFGDVGGVGIGEAGWWRMGIGV